MTIAAGTIAQAQLQVGTGPAAVPTRVAAMTAASDPATVTAPEVSALAAVAPQFMRIRAGAVIVRDGSVLVVEYEDDLADLHYNLPGGGLEPGETLYEGVRREVREETEAEVEVGRLLLVTEWGPRVNEHTARQEYHLGMYFECHLLPGSEPRLPEQPDPNQTAVRWIPLADLSTIPLLPRIAPNVLAALAHTQGPNPHFTH